MWFIKCFDVYRLWTWYCSVVIKKHTRERTFLRFSRLLPGARTCTHTGTHTHTHEPTPPSHPQHRLPNISYSPKSRRLAVGGRSGQVVVYDLKQGRTQTVNAHSHPVTTLVFSDDGKMLAIYAYGDSMLSVWQVRVQSTDCSDNLTHIRMHTHPLTHTRTRAHPPTHTHTHTDQLLFVWHEPSS